MNGALDFHPVVPRLYQGGAVLPERSYNPFSMLVLCAQEHQPVMPRFRGKLIRPAFDDTNQPTADEIARAQAASRAVVREYRRNPTANILVTCYAGWNRSGLVTALALNELTNWSTDQIVNVIKAARGPNALSNSTFCLVVDSFNPMAARRRAELQATLRRHRHR